MGAFTKPGAIWVLSPTLSGNVTRSVHGALSVTSALNGTGTLRVPGALCGTSAFSDRDALSYAGALSSLDILSGPAPSVAPASSMTRDTRVLDGPAPSAA